MNIRHLLLLGIAVLIGLTAVVGTLVYARPHTFQGSLYDPPLPAADFALKDQHGRTFRLSENKGSIVLMFFGYSNCPDVCPVTLSDFKKIKEQLGDQAKDVRFLFITTDPERDSPERLLEYLDYFDPTIIGLTGDRADLEPVWDAYGVYQAKVDTGSASGYMVDHTTRVYLIDTEGNFRMTFQFGTEAHDMAGDVAELLGRK
jgi:protein SCO1/2